MTTPDNIEITPLATEAHTNTAGCVIIQMPTQANRVGPTRIEQATAATSSAHQRLPRWAIKDAAGNTITKAEGKRADIAAQFPKRELVQLSAHFQYQGRWWRLFKRSERLDAPFYIEFERKGDVPPRTLRSLETALLTTAEAEAKSYIDAFLARRRDERSGLAPRVTTAPSSTFGDLFARVAQLDMDCDPKGRHTYIWGVRKFFSFVLQIEEEAVAAQPLTSVNAATGEKFFTRAITHAAALPSQVEQNKFRRQCDSWFRNTKALFGADSVRSMPALGVTPPSAEAIAGFRKAKPRRFKVHKATEFVPPGHAILRATFRQWIKLGRTPGYLVRGGAVNTRTLAEPQPLHDIARRNMFIAIGLMLAFGLRKNEVRQLRWRHLTKDALGQPRLIAHDVKVKNKTASIEVKPLNPFWHILSKTIARHGWRGEPDDYVMAQRTKLPGEYGELVFSRGGKSDRLHWVFYHIGKWLRSLGWKLQKTNHALRDCSASYVTMKWGLMRAKKFCRHEQLQTTESHYNKFVDEDLMDDPKRLAWLTWAK